MADRYIITYFSGVLLKSTVYDGAVLHIHRIAHFNIMHIASYHRIEPDAAIVSHHHIAYHGCIGRNKTVFAEHGILAIDREYGCHKYAIFVFRMSPINAS